MHVNQKISLNKYIPFTLGIYLILLFSFQLADYIKESGTVLILFVVNHILLIETFAPLFVKDQVKRPSVIKLGFFHLLKFFLIAGTFYYVATYARPRIIFYLLLYIFQLIILLLSIKRDRSKN